MGRFRTLILLLIVMPGWQTAMSAEPQSKSSGEESSEQFVRLSRGADEKPLALQTAIARFRATDTAQDGLKVDLVGAIHIADKSYYEELNRRFRGYDAVLYELVAPAEANIPRPGERSGSAIGGLQVGMKSVLDLQFQLDCVDYAAKNLVHADMTPEEFADTMRARNESFTGMFFRMMGRALGEQAKKPLGGGDLRLMAAMFAPDRAHQMKLVMAEQAADEQWQRTMFDDPDGSTIITERNKKALEVLSREIAAGKKRVAIFYGAAHLVDLQRRLQEEFGMEREGTEWISAWSLTPAEN